MTAVLAALLPLLVSPAAARGPVVVAGAERIDVREQYRSWSDAQGVHGADAELVCKLLAEAVQLCFSTEGPTGERTYLTAARKQAGWKGAPEDLAPLERAARTHARKAVADMQPRTPEGLPAGFSSVLGDGTPRYWMSARADGRAHAPLLDPAALTARFGPSWVVAVPTRDLLVLWVPGDAQLDKIMAVGVRRAFDGAPESQVSPFGYRWTEEGWVTWGAAVPAEPEAPADDLGAPASFP
jgi:hypothetical protein